MIAILILVMLLCELRSFGYFVLLVVSFVFLLVSLLPSLCRSCLTSSLVFLLYLVVGTFISTSSLLVFFVLYEFSLFPVCLLILLLGYQPEKISSTYYLMLYTVVCSAPFLYYSVSLNTRLNSGFGSISDYTRTLVCLSFMVKSPLYTLHAWLPKAHVEAPLIGSVLLAGVILKLGRYGLLLLAPSLFHLSSIFVYLSLSGGVICSAICCRN